MVIILSVGQYNAVIRGSLITTCTVIVLVHLRIALGQDTYSYSDQQSWGGICNTGSSQSPISIEISNAVLNLGFGNLEIDYDTDALPTVINDDLKLEVESEEAFGTFTIGSITYDLTQFHFHSPSEHSVDGKSYSLELHLVHTAVTESGTLTAVIGVLYNENLLTADPFLQQVFAAIPSLQAPGSSVTVDEPFDFSPLESELRQAYVRYSGSLTTPPCTEGVTWTAVTTPNPMSSAQYEAYRKLFPEPTNRDIQPLNGKILEKYCAPTP